MRVSQKILNSDGERDYLVKRTQPVYRYNNNMDLSLWKKALKEKFVELIGLERIKSNACSLNFEIEWKEDKENYYLIRFTVESEIGEIVPCYMTIPKLNKKKYPVAIVLQGHFGDIKRSIGEFDTGENKDFVLEKNAFCLQAIENGYIGLAIELRGLGEKLAKRTDRSSVTTCRWATRTAFSLGRTIIAERIWDIIRVVDALVNFEECDLDKIFIVGDEVGATTGYYTACLDERIKMCVMNGGFSSYVNSIFSVEHCGCYYIPFSYEWFDMPELSVMIAPRKLKIISNENVREDFRIVKCIYESMGDLNGATLIERIAEYGWNKELVWDEVKKEIDRLGW